MSCSAWTDLPARVKEAVQARAGTVTDLEPAPSGNHAHIAGTLHTANGRIFVKGSRKGAHDDGPEVRALRNEANIVPHVQPYAPRLFWTLEEAGWLLLGFEHIAARHADYSPDSPDLPLLAKTLEAFQSMECPDAVVRHVERRWAAVADDVTPMAGNTLLHADINPANLLITPDGRTYVVDWAFTSRGAAWVELGLLIPWLLKAGHSPAETAEWISQFPSWAEADPAAIDLFSRAFAETWHRRSDVDPASPWKVELAALTRLWADYRLR